MPYLIRSSPSLFPSKRHGPTKRYIGRLLATANAGAGNYMLAAVREEFYALKRKLLEKYGEKDGVDWQEITQLCFGCEACGDSWREAACDGKGIYSQRWIPLERFRLGREVFHTPGLSVANKPAAEIKFRGLVPHRPVTELAARRAFTLLCLMFDLPLYRYTAPKMFDLARVGGDF